MVMLIIETLESSANKEIMSMFPERVI